jgi:single-stranded-DNA-specific exonuclease
LLDRFGGHAQALGMSVASDRLEEVRAAWLALAEALPPAARERPPLEYDLALDAGEISPQLAAGIERFEPFGSGNPEPLFRVGPLRCDGEPRRFGRGHLELRARDEAGGAMSILGWDWAERSGPWSGSFEVVGAIELDSRRAASRARLRLVDARVANASAD